LRAAKLAHGLADAEAIRNVVIEDNDFQDRAGSAVFVGGATGVTVRSNRIVAGATTELRRKGPAILVELSSGVVLAANTVSDPRPGTTAAVEIGANVPPGEAGVRNSGLKTVLAPEARPVLDRRAAR
jgi:nitrous oxidase accessory protein NosD